MLHVFIDPSVLLRFYAYSDDTLNEVEKLTALASAGAVTIYCTDQSLDEHARNRDKELSETIKKLSLFSAPVQIPRFAEHREQVKQYRAAVLEARAAHQNLLDIITKDVNEGNLRADHIIDALFGASKNLRRTNSVITEAQLRNELASPPGKKDSLGDQINWEILLRGVPDGEDLHVISRDLDYFGVNDSTPNFFLSREWKTKKAGTLYVYQGLAPFAKQHFPDIKFPEDAVKVTAIKDLVTSKSFSQTHKQIAILQQLKDKITLEEASVIFEAFASSSQIHGIQSDADVNIFYGDLYSKYWNEISDELAARLSEAENDDELIFVPF